MSTRERKEISREITETVQRALANQDKDIDEMFEHILAIIERRFAKTEEAIHDCSHRIVLLSQRTAVEDSHQIGIINRLEHHEERIVRLETRGG